MLVFGLFLFYQGISSPRTYAWYLTQPVSMRKLSGIVKEIRRGYGLLMERMSCSCRTMCVMRMATKGVPAPISMLITVHKSQGACAQHDQSTDSEVRAIQKCSSRSSNFEEKCQEENKRFKKVIQEIEEEDLSWNKQVKADNNK